MTSLERRTSTRAPMARSLRLMSSILLSVARDACARKFRFLESCDGREFPRASDLPLDAFEHRRDLFGFEFEGHRPARKFRRIAKKFAQFIGIDFDDDPSVKTSIS